MPTSPQPQGQPQTEEEWTVHAINIHGTIFQRWCQQMVEDSPPWTLKSVEYPVAYPPPERGWPIQESALDILAQLDHGETHLTLLIECKKHNPSLVNWLFFPNPNHAGVRPMALERLEVTGGRRVVNRERRESMLVSGVYVNDAREVRGDYLKARGNDKTKTANTAIQEAAHQVALATQTVMLEEAVRQVHLGQSGQASPLHSLYLPMIVTSAHLFTFEFNPAAVDAQTGEIGWADASIVPRPFVVYEYALPRRLFLPSVPNYPSVDDIKRHARMPIVVVQSAAFPVMLQELATQAGHLSA